MKKQRTIRFNIQDFKREGDEWKARLGDIPRTHLIPSARFILVDGDKEVELQLTGRYTVTSGQIVLWTFQSADGMQLKIS